MARKIKPVVQSTKKTTNESISADNAISTEVPCSIQANVFLNDELKKKLEEYDNIQSQYSEMLHENEDLQTKLAEYILELDQCKNAKEDLQKMSSLNNALETELSQLKESFEKMQSENDKYLMKISELTFENSKLNNILENLSSTQSTNISKQQNVVQQYSNNHVVNGYSNNGYGDWN